MSTEFTLKCGSCGHTTSFDIKRRRSRSSVFLCRNCFQEQCLLGHTSGCSGQRCAAEYWDIFDSKTKEQDMDRCCLYAGRNSGIREGLCSMKMLEKTIDAAYKRLREPLRNMREWPECGGKRLELETKIYNSYSGGYVYAFFSCPAHQHKGIPVMRGYQLPANSVVGLP